MAEREILIRAAGVKDLDSIFYLYSSYMFDSYFIGFNRLFVKNYLKGILESKNCIALIAEESQIIGFIVVTISCQRTSLELLFDIGIVCAWARNFFLHPGLAFRSLELFFYPFRTNLKDVNAELLFIAIEPAYRDKGLATQLIKEALNLMRQKGIKKVKVSTLAENDPVNVLLERLGFKTEKTFRLFRKHMYLYGFELS